MGAIGGRLEIAGSSATLCLAGELDLAAADDVMALASAALHMAVLDELVIDLSDVTFMDAAGLGTLLTARNLADKASVEFVLRGISDPLVRIFEITGLAEWFGIPLADAGRC